MSQLPLIPSSQEKAEMNSVVFELDPVFTYQIGDKLKNPLKASEWDTSNPVWDGKLQIVEVPPNRCQVQLVSNNSIFGVVANKDPMFQSVLDSSRYFTTEIKNSKSGENEVIGIGFINRSDGSQLFKVLLKYSTSKDSITTDEPDKCRRSDLAVAIEINDGIPESGKVQATNLHESKSDKSTYIQCQSDSVSSTDTTTDILQKQVTTSNEQSAERETRLECQKLGSTGTAGETTDVSLKSNKHDSAIVKTTITELKNGQVKVTLTSQESPSDKAPCIQYLNDSSLRTYTAADLFKKHFETSNEQNADGQTNLHCLELNSTVGAATNLSTKCNQKDPVIGKTTFKVPEKSQVEVNTLQESRSVNSTYIQCLNLKGSNIRSHATADIFKNKFETSNKQNAESETRLECQELTNTAGATTDVAIKCNENNPVTVDATIIAKPGNVQVKVNASEKSQSDQAPYNQCLKDRSLRKYTAADIFKKCFETSNQINAERNTHADSQVLSRTAGATTDVPIKCNQKNQVIVGATISKAPEKIHAEVNSVNNPQRHHSDSTTYTRHLKNSSINTHAIRDTFKKQFETSNEKNADRGTHLDCQKLSSTVSATADVSLKSSENNPVTVKSTLKLPKNCPEKVEAITSPDSQIRNTTYTWCLKDSSLRTYTAADIFKNHFETSNEQHADKQTSLHSLELNSTVGAATNVSMKCNEKDPVLVNTTFKLSEKSQVEVNTLQESQSFNSTYIRCLNLKGSSFRSKATSDIFTNKFETKNEKNTERNTHLDCQEHSSTAGITPDVPIKCNKENPVTVPSAINIKVPSKMQVQVKTSPAESRIFNATRYRCLKGSGLRTHNAADIFKKLSETSNEQNAVRETHLDCQELGSTAVLTTDVSIKCNQKNPGIVKNTIAVPEKNQVEVNSVNTSQEPQSDKAPYIQCFRDSSLRKYTTSDIFKKHVETSNENKSERNTHLYYQEHSSKAGATTTGVSIKCNKKNPATVQSPISIKVPEKRQVKVTTSPELQLGKATYTPCFRDSSLRTYTAADIFKKHSETSIEKSADTETHLDCQELISTAVATTDVSIKCNEKDLVAVGATFKVPRKSQVEVNSVTASQEPQSDNATYIRCLKDSNLCTYTTADIFKKHDETSIEKNVERETNLDCQKLSSSAGTATDVPIKCIENNSWKFHLETSKRQNANNETSNLDRLELELNSTHSIQVGGDTLAAHTRKRQEVRAVTSQDKNNVEKRILNSDDDPKSKTTLEKEITSEKEAHCTIAKKRKIELQSPQGQVQSKLESNPMRNDTVSLPEQTGVQESVDGSCTRQKPSEQSGSGPGPSSLPSEELSENKNGTSYFDSVTREWTCHLCGFKTSDMTLLLSHWEKDHNMKEPNTCNICYLIFITPEQLLKHTKALHNTVCSMCSLKFSNQRTHNRHMSRVHQKGRLPRSDDGDKPEEGEITIDSSSEDEGPFSTSKKWKFELQLQDQKKLNTNQPLITDFKQEKKVGQEPPRPYVHVPSFFPSEELSDSENGTLCLHPVTLQLLCPLCGFRTYSKSDMKLLLSHWRKDHDMTRLNTCRLCYIIFSTPEKRLSHLKVHPFVCFICSLEFKLEQHLLGHIKKCHVKLRSWMSPDIDNNHNVCNRCSKEFENTKDLVDHFKLTNSTTQFTQCSATTTTIVQKYENGINYSLEIGKKNQFVCHLCPTSAKFCSLKLIKLLDHWETKHNLREPKANTCGVCHLIFSTAQQRLNHSKALHKVCDICSLEFGKQKLHNLHMESVHKIGISKERKEKRAETTREGNDRQPTATAVQTLSGGDKNKGGKATVKIEVITILDSDSEEEVAPCSSQPKKKRTESVLQDQNKLESVPMQIGADSQPQQNDSQEPSGSGQCVPSDLPSVGLPGNDNGKCFMDPITLKLICPLCSFQTHSKSDMLLLLSHWRKVHDMNKPIICNLCYIMFLTAEEHLAHKNCHHFICPICTLEFTESKNLLSHVEIWHLKRGFCMASHNDKRYKCNQCSMEFENINTWMDHFRSTNTNTTTQRGLSSVTLGNQSTTPFKKFKMGFKYSLQVGGKTQFVCHLCPTPNPKLCSLKTLNKLLDHWVRIHDLREPIICNLCNIVFSTSRQRLNHASVFHFACLLCSLEFGKEKIHNRHMFKVHGVEP